MPPGAGTALSAALAVLPNAPHERHLLARARRFARFAHVPLVERAARWNSLFPDGVGELLQPDLVRAAADPLAHGLERRTTVIGTERFPCEPIGQA